MPFQIIDFGALSFPVGSEIGFVEGAITCAGIKLGVADAGANPNRIVAMGLGYLIINVNISSTSPRLTRKIRVRLVILNNLFTR